ncbi:MAG TPA: S8 family serine peptidase, partial [Pyrinomonadaceae bacterium]|nr:S8 family serine peptidase [Pyrinomonadaceae bacterium]
MRKSIAKIIIGQLLLISIAVPTMVIGHTPRDLNVPVAPAVAHRANSFLLPVTQQTQADESPFAREAAHLVKVVAGSARKNAVVIDRGTERDGVVKAAASQLQDRAKVVRQIDWNALFTSFDEETEMSAALEGIIAAIERTKGKTVLYVDDISAFSNDVPLYGQIAAKLLYDAIASGKIQVISAATADRFTYQITADKRLKGRFEKVEVAEKDADAFVGDKLSPDLRELVNGADSGKRVKVILQADDIGDPALLATLKRNGVTIESKAESLDMMTVELPISAAEQIASARGSRHLSLDRQVSLLGHIETTTGASLVRVIDQGLSLSLLGTTAINTSTELDGRGIGIAIVDSSIREDHRMFVDKNGVRRVVQRANFTDDSHVDVDEFGHGTHVASLAAGSVGQNLNTVDGLYLGNYRGIASGAKIINVRVLDDNGIGNTTRLINALNWLYDNRAANNIRVVNLSLGAPAVESWRNDPLCRAVRKLTAAGMVVVAAAGNNGKTAAGQKIYGAIHSPGNDPTVITVGAANTFGTDARNDDGVTTYSSRGPTRSYWLDDAGTKHYDHLIKPDLVAPGNMVIGAESRGSELIDENRDLNVFAAADDARKMMYMSGTSMATPIVSGAVA